MGSFPSNVLCSIGTTLAPCVGQLREYSTACNVCFVHHRPESNQRFDYIQFIAILFFFDFKFYMTSVENLKHEFSEKLTSEDLDLGNTTQELAN